MWFLNGILKKNKVVIEDQFALRSISAIKFNANEKIEVNTDFLTNFLIALLYKSKRISSDFNDFESIMMKIILIIK